MLEVNQKILEKQLQKKIIDCLNDNNIYNFKVIIKNRNGIPDIISIIDPEGRFCSIEVKGEDTKHLEKQILEGDRIKSHGGKHYVIRAKGTLKESWLIAKPILCEIYGRNLI